MISGVLLLDKPVGWSSTQALGRAKRLIGERKAGHAGTLDPFAEGLLPICFGEATKFSSFLLGADKTYLATARLGVQTTTGDTEGTVTAERPVTCSQSDVIAVLQAMRGEHEQVPPMYSALKQNGVPLYRLARQGIEVERKPRRVSIHRLDLVDFQPPMLHFSVTCSGGTYVRTLAEDIGHALGCGAHLTGLRRSAVGPLDGSGLVSLAALEAEEPAERRAHLLPVSTLAQGLPRADLSLEVGRALLQGRVVSAPQGTKQGQLSVYSDGEFIGVATADELGSLVADRMMSMSPKPATSVA